MRTFRPFLLSFALSLAVPSAQVVLAHEPTPNSGAAAEKKSFPSLGAAWAEAKAGADDLEKGITAKDSKKAHAGEERVSAALNWMGANSPIVTGDQAPRLAGAIKGALKAADGAHDAADAGDFAKADTERKKLTGALKLIEAQYPKGSL